MLNFNRGGVMGGGMMSRPASSPSPSPSPMAPPLPSPSLGGLHGIGQQMPSPINAGVMPMAPGSSIGVYSPSPIPQPMANPSLPISAAPPSPSPSFGAPQGLQRLGMMGGNQMGKM